MSELTLATVTACLQPRAASSHKGKKRLVTILQVAREVFSIDGYSRLTLRRVASEAGMHLASLQHYFATKEDLLGALISDTIFYHEGVLQGIMDKPASSREDRFICFVRHQLAEHQNAQTCGFFFQLWSLAPNHNFARSLMAQMYKNYRRQLSLLICDIRPDLGKSEIQQRATLIVAMLEGLMLLIGGKKNPPAHIKRLCKKTEDTVLQIVTT